MIRLNRRAMLAGLAGSGLAIMTGADAAQPGFFARTGAKIGLQLYTLGDAWVRDMPGTFAELASIGVRDLELPGLWGQSAQDVRAAADAAGVAFSSIHLSAAPMPGVGGLSLASEAGEIARVLGVLGISDAVLPLPPLPADFAFVPGKTGPADLAVALAKAGLDGWKQLADLLNTKARALAPHGITLGYHNHNVEFASIGGTTGWDVLLAATDPDLVQFELDLGWVAAAGIDPAQMLRRMKGRVRWLHVKDLKASTPRNTALKMDPAEVGSGKTNWPRVLAAAQAAGVRRYYIEQEPPFTIARMDAVRRSHAYLSAVV
ncbi:MAG TPA: sugar phosphate isomerase/epimerase [Chakrabartia sp.]|nr:sugar phosphate isomerase/epimerase [Chakrabartia sp.]